MVNQYVPEMSVWFVIFQNVHASVFSNLSLPGY